MMWMRSSGKMVHELRVPPPAGAIVGLVVMFLTVAAAGRSAGEILGTAPEAARPAAVVQPRQRSAGCDECSRGTCRNARHRMMHEQKQRPQAGHHAHSACRGGECSRPGCPACCPVRPGRFGFYGTEWRNWPGSGQVVQASYDAAATPARPPKLEVPTADEESPGADDAPVDETDEPAPSAAEPEPFVPTLPAPAATEPKATEPATPTNPAAPTNPATPATPEPTPAPAATPPAPAKGADNLFDEASLHRQRYQRLELLNQAARKQEQVRQEALRQSAALMLRSTAPATQMPDLVSMPELPLEIPAAAEILAPIELPAAFPTPEPIAAFTAGTPADAVTPVHHEQPIRSTNPMRYRDPAGPPASNPLR